MLTPLQILSLVVVALLMVMALIVVGRNRWREYKLRCDVKRSGSSVEQQPQVLSQLKRWRLQRLVVANGCIVVCAVLLWLSR